MQAEIDGNSATHHIGPRSHQAGHGLSRCQPLRATKVSHFNVTLRGHQHILQLQVPMENPVGVEAGDSAHQFCNQEPIKPHTHTAQKNVSIQDGCCTSNSSLQGMVLCAHYTLSGQLGFMPSSHLHVYPSQVKPQGK